MTDARAVDLTGAWPSDAGQGLLAVIDHMRTWERFDGPVRERIENDGGMTAYTAAAISIEYGLMQSLRGRGGFSRFGLIAELVNRTAEGLTSSEDLRTRCAAASRLAVQIRAQAGIDRTPYSAASKLIWFVRPERWTMFDQHAFRAVYRSDHGRQFDFPDFYAALDGAGFCEMADKLDSHARSTGLLTHGTRILDKLLMLRGTAGSDRFSYFTGGVRRESEEYLGTMDAVSIQAAIELGQMADSWTLSPERRESRRKRTMESAVA